MYAPKGDSEGWTCDIIRGIECWKPPEGYVWHPIEKKLNYVGVIKRTDGRGDCIWTPDRLDDDYYEKWAIEEDAQELNPDHFDPNLEKLRDLYWHRRLCGVWFMLGERDNPKPVYITGLHYFYISWWNMDIGLPKYRDNDRKYFRFILQGVDDYRCKGSIKITKRRGGKTYQLGCFIYETISRMKKASGGIQSKTETDAHDKVYRDAVKLPFEELPHFFVPQKINWRSIDNRLEFSEPSKAGTHTRTSVQRGQLTKGLKSIIDSRSSNEAAYDGYKMQAYGSDEASKVKNADIFERHMVIQFCLEQEEDIIGYAIYTTTVEDMKGRNEDFRKLWNYSKHEVRNANGRTKSGMYQYFEPASETMFFDKFGMPDAQKATDFINNEAEALKDDRKAYISYRKKNPLKIEHAFLIDDGSSPFDQLKLNERLDILQWSEDGTYSKRYRLDWTDGQFSKVIATLDPRGKFYISELPLDEDANNVVIENSKYTPKNTSRYTSGLDPYRFNKAKQGGSKAGFVIKKKFWLEDPFGSNKPVLYWLERPSTKNKAYDEIMKALWFYGSDILAERNAGNFPDWMEENNLTNFAVYIDGSFGIFTTAQSNAKLIEYMEEYIFKNSEKIDFEALIVNAIDFDPDNTERFDLMMAWMICEASDRIKISVRKKQKSSNSNVKANALMTVLRRHSTKSF